MVFVILHRRNFTHFERFYGAECALPCLHRNPLVLFTPILTSPATFFLFSHHKHAIRVLFCGAFFLFPIWHRSFPKCLEFSYGVFRYLPILHRNSLKTRISLRCNSRSPLFCTVNRPATSKPYGANTAISTSHRNHLTVIKFFLYFLMFSPLNRGQKCAILP